MENRDFWELNDELENEKSAILAEAYQAEELLDMADLLEAKGVTDNSELIELARYTAEHNALSESAIDIREELLEALRNE